MIWRLGVIDSEMRWAAAKGRLRSLCRAHRGEEAKCCNNSKLIHESQYSIACAGSRPTRGSHWDTAAWGTDQFHRTVCSKMVEITEDHFL